MENMGKRRVEFPIKYIYPAAQLPTNDTIKVLHKKTKEEYDKARTAWEEGGRKAWSSRKADMDNNLFPQGASSIVHLV